MSLKEKEEKIAELEKKLAVIKNDREIDSSKIEETINDYKKETYSHLCAYDRVCLICLNYIWLKISYKLPKICSYFQSCHTSCFLIYMSLLIMCLMSL